MCCGKGWSMMEGTMENYKGSGLGRKRKGFMLLELIIVVAIVGILSAVAMPDILGMTNDAKAARIQADLSAIGTASEMYYVKNGEYPTALSQLVDTTGANGYLKKMRSRRIRV